MTSWSYEWHPSACRCNVKARMHDWFEYWNITFNKSVSKHICMYCVFIIALLVVGLYLSENYHTHLLQVPIHAVDSHSTITDLPIHPELIFPPTNGLSYENTHRADHIFY